jgi:hypothetical protein
VLKITKCRSSTREHFLLGLQYGRVLGKNSLTPLLCEMSSNRVKARRMKRYAEKVIKLSFHIAGVTAVAARYVLVPTLGSSFKYLGVVH